MKKALHLLLAATLLFSCSKKDNSAPVAENNFTYNQILDSLRITCDVPYVYASVSQKDTIIFTTAGQILEKTNGGIHQYSVVLSMQTATQNGALIDGWYRGTANTTDTNSAPTALFKGFLNAGLTFQHRRTNSRADTTKTVVFYYQSNPISYTRL